MSLSGLDPVPRIGCVPYLNARPLLEGIRSPVIERVPAQLYDIFQEDKLDAALLSSIDVLKLLKPAVVDGISISCKGPVLSVLLAYSGDLSDLRSVELDPSSHTSNFLARVVLEDFYGLKVDYVELQQRTSANPPAVIIGDPALALAKCASHSSLKFLDLGEEWMRHTGLPFVFALWTLRTDYPQKSKLASMLRSAKTDGLGSLERIVNGTTDPKFTRTYLGKAICYDLDEDEKRGLKCFQEFLEKKNGFSCSRIQYF